MSKAQYDIYVEQNLQLIRTMVIKSETTAYTMNMRLKELGESVDPQRPETWRYYLNLAGEYHPLDRKMYVKSLDTLQTIEFTKENLRHHASTHREYSRRGVFYEKLIATYPDQEFLIDGILNPVDIQKAIRAKEGSILYYDPKLVEPNEINVIPKLEQWIQWFQYRWNLPAYMLTDDLYVASQLGVLYSLLPIQLMNIRLENCFTRYVHSYHVKMHLASNGRLDIFMDYLTKSQQLWLYRNIRYIRRNPGKRHTFNLLTKRLLTDRAIPLAEWNMRHEVGNISLVDVPKIEFDRQSVNQLIAGYGADTIDTHELMNREQPLARHNARVQPIDEPKSITQFETTRQDRLPTKVLESALLDTSDAHLYTFADHLLNYWIYFSQTGQYNTVITVDHPATGATISLGVKDAFLVYLFLYNRSIGVTMQHTPIVQAWFVRRRPTPSRTELATLIEDRFNPETHVDTVLNNLAPVGMFYVSTEGFYKAVKDIHDNVLWQQDYWASQEDLHEHSQVKTMIHRLYTDYTCRLDGEVPYYQWFLDKGLDLYEINRDDALVMWKQILEKATGVDLHSVNTVRDIQTAMLRLMSRLSSYSIQFIQQINRQPLQELDWSYIRPTDHRIKGRASDVVETAGLRVLDTKAKGRDIADITPDEYLQDITPMAKTRVRTEIETGTGSDLTGRLIVRTYLDSSVLDIFDFVYESQPQDAIIRVLSDERPSSQVMVKPGLLPTNPDQAIRYHKPR